MSDSFDPYKTDSSGTGEDVVDFSIWRDARNIFDSYHGQIDSFVELIQNSMDALEKRFHYERDGDDIGEESPTILIAISLTDNSLRVVDNGVGMTKEEAVRFLKPHFSPKDMIDDFPTRGQKGVGTAFLAYGHKSFKLFSRKNGEDFACEIHGGVDWISNKSSFKDRPLFSIVDANSDVVDSFENFSRGTSVTVTFGGGTKLKSLARLLHSDKSDVWAFVLRTQTAIGHAVFGQDTKAPSWMDDLMVEIQIDGNVPVEIEASFAFPHEVFSSRSRTGDMSDLMGDPNNNNKNLSLIYWSMNYTELEVLLSAEIKKLKEEDGEDSDVARLLEKYKPEIYVSRVKDNTFYEKELTSRAAPSTKPSRFSIRPNFGGGVLVTCNGMPIGRLEPNHYGKLKPEDKARNMLIVNFGEEYNPDVGRKGNLEVRPLIEWLSQVTNRRLRKFGKKRFEISREGSAHGNTSKDDAEEQLRTKSVEIFSDIEAALRYGCLWGREPVISEVEVVCVFVELWMKGVLKGYELHSFPAKEMFDGLFSYNLQEGVDFYESDRFGVSSSYIPVARTKVWLEFKINVAGAVKDFKLPDGESNKKYPGLLRLLIAWDVGGVDVMDYELTAFDESNWTARRFYGATHYLEGDGEVTEVILLKEYFDEIVSEVES